jgi:hypothetical protein
MWTYVLTELNGNEIGEVNDATARSLGLGLNRISTSSFTIRADNAMMSAVFNDDTLLKVYQDKTLRFHGPVTSTELSADGETAETVRVNAASPAWKLARRLLGLSSAGKTYTGDKAKTARKMINELNTDTATYPTNPETGIRLNAEGTYSAGSGEYVAGPYAAALSCINDLAHTLNGFDWYVYPEEYNSGKLGYFEAQQVFGSTKPHVIFEYGTGQKNIKTMNYVRDIADLSNKAFHLPGDMEKEGVLSAFNEASALHRGRFEAVADAFGITVTSLREAWLSEFIRVKSNPRFVVSMSSDIDDGSGRVPRLGTDYWLGDFVTARAAFSGATLFSGKVRVYGVDVDIDEAGEASVTPILLDEEGGEL